MSKGRGEGSGLGKQRGSEALELSQSGKKGSGSRLGRLHCGRETSGWIRGEAEREGEQRGREERSRSSAISLARGATTLTLCRGACRAAGEGKREGMKEGRRTERRIGRHARCRRCGVQRSGLR